MLPIQTTPVTTLASDRIFGPHLGHGLSPQWDDPCGLNPPQDKLLSWHRRLHMQLSSDHDRCAPWFDVLRARSYRVAQYQGLGTGSAIEDVEQDLRWFTSEANRHTLDGFIAFFDDETLQNRNEVEHQFWSQMMGMFARDPDRHHWQPDLSSDPDNPDHAFCINGSMLDLIFLHPHDEEPSRRFITPTLMLLRRPLAQPESWARRAGLIENTADDIADRDGPLRVRVPAPAWGRRFA